MANMGSRKHLKRFKAPKMWPIHNKKKKKFGLQKQVLDHML